MDAAAEVRAQNARNAEVNFAVVRQALDYIKETNSAAMTRVGLIMEDWSEERMDYEEDRLFIGLKTSETEPENPYDGERDEWGTALPTAGSEVVTTPMAGNPPEVEDSFSASSSPIQFPDCQPGEDAQTADDGNNWTLEDE